MSVSLSICPFISDFIGSSISHLLVLHSTAHPLYRHLFLDVLHFKNHVQNSRCSFLAAVRFQVRIMPYRIHLNEQVLKNLTFCPLCDKGWLDLRPPPTPPIPIPTSPSPHLADQSIFIRSLHLGKRVKPAVTSKVFQRWKTIHLVLPHPSLSSPLPALLAKKARHLEECD